jgi:glycosyltransferase involved in cell wall biosynthesis
MNILILANKPPYPAKDGSSLATLTMAIGLAKSDNRVTILAISTPKHSCTIEQIPVELKWLIDLNLVNINTKINPFKGIYNLIFSRLPYNIERFIDKSYTLKLIEIIKANRFDIIQIEGLCLIPYLNAIKKITDTPIVYRSHNIEHEIWSRISINEKSWFKSRYFKLLSKRIFKMEVEIPAQVNALVAISKRDEEWFRSNGFRKPAISIPSGYINSISTKIGGLSNNNICYLGSLDWKPNQEGLKWFLLEVWPKVLKTFPNLTFHVAGRNTPDSIIEMLKNEKGVVFHGEVESSQEYLNNYSILAVPILSGSGMRVKIVEGMMLGKAIVTSTIGIEGIDAVNGEIVIIADSPDDFANALIGLVNQPNQKSSIAEKARIFAKDHFDNSRLTEKLESFYKQLI